MKDRKPEERVRIICWLLGHKIKKSFCEITGVHLNCSRCGGQWRDTGHYSLQGGD
jgi:hypothetical protein